MYIFYYLPPDIASENIAAVMRAGGRWLETGYANWFMGSKGSSSTGGRGRREERWKNRLDFNPCVSYLDITIISYNDCTHRTTPIIWLHGGTANQYQA